MSKGGGQSQTTTQSNLPPGYALGKFKTAANDAGYNYLTGGSTDPQIASLLAQRSELMKTMNGNPADAEKYYGVTQQLQELANKAQEYFPGSTVADFSQQSEDSLAQLEALARGGSPLIDAAQAQALKTLNGDYLNTSTNPYLKDMIDQTSRDTVRNYKTAVMPELSSAFANSGRYGSQAFSNAGSAAKSNLATEIGDIATKINYNNYATERGYQNSAMNNAGALDDMKYNPSRVLGQVGALRDSQAQAKLNDDVARYNYTRDLPTQRLNNFIAQLQGTSSGFGTNTQTQQTSGGGSSLLGGLSSIAGIAGLASGLGGFSALGSLFPGAGQSVGGLLSSSPMGPYLPFGVG